jgi:hypothetical protein
MERAFAADVPGACRIEGGGERDSFVRPHEPKLMHD